MRVLSLFDGISTGLYCLKQLEIEVEKYYSSEVDKYAMAISNKNHPEIEQLGDVKGWHWWNIDWDNIDLLIAGSPCQGFSFAGKQLAFDDPRSKLFFEFVAILNHIKAVNPNVKFLLENVKMKEEFEHIITEYVGVDPIMIDAALVSAQRRKRLYWTNIEGVEQPEDRGIVLKDILQTDDEVDEKYYLSDKYTIKFMSNKYPHHTKINKKGKKKRNQNKASCLTAGGHSGGNHSDMDLLVTRDSTQIGYVNNSNSQGNRVYSDDGKSTTLVGNAGGLGAKTGLYNLNSRIRRLTPIECERLQGMPDNYTAGVSNSQRYKALGNGWQADVIEHIFSNL
jgi:DNA-cytosine methyltransferase